MVVSHVLLTQVASGEKGSNPSQKLKVEIYRILFLGFGSLLRLSKGFGKHLKNIEFV